MRSALASAADRLGINEYSRLGPWVASNSVPTAGLWWVHGAGARGLGPRDADSTGRVNLSGRFA